MTTLRTQQRQFFLWQCMRPDQSTLPLTALFEISGGDTRRQNKQLKLAGDSESDPVDVMLGSHVFPRKEIMSNIADVASEFCVHKRLPTFQCSSCIHCDGLYLKGKIGLSRHNFVYIFRSATGYRLLGLLQGSRYGASYALKLRQMGCITPSAASSNVREPVV